MYQRTVLRLALLFAFAGRLAAPPPINRRYQMTNNKFRILLTAVAYCLLPTAYCLLSLSSFAQAPAPPPEQIAFQGRLLDSAGVPQTGTFDMIFDFYDAPKNAPADPDGTLLLTYRRDRGAGDAGVTAANGIYTVRLGEAGGALVPGGQTLGALFRNNAAVYLEVQVRSAAPAPFERLLPRTRLVSVSGALVAGSLVSNVQNALTLNPFGAAAGNTGEARFMELAANGMNFVGLKAPDAIAADRVWTLPAADGAAGQVLSTDGTGGLSWLTPSGGSVSSISAGAPGAVTGTSGLTFSANPITTAGSIAIATGGVTNAMLANASVTVTAGTGLSGGGSVALGGSVTVDLGTLTGLTAGADTLSVVYGSAANTAAQGNTAIAVNTTGNLTGGGAGTAGGGLSLTLDTVANPTFSTSVTTPLVTNAGTLALSATGANVIAFSTNGSERARIDASGSVGIGTTAPGTLLDVAGAVTVREMAAPAVAPADQGRIYFDAAANKFRVSEHGGPYVDLVSGGTVTGSGTATRIAFWNTASSLSSNANLYWDNTNNRLGIGTASPGSALHVYGGGSASAIQLDRSGLPGTTAVWRYNTGTVEFGPVGGDNLQFNTADVARVFIANPSGNVGIGTTNPGARLDINGGSLTGLAISNINGAPYALTIDNLTAASGVFGFWQSDAGRGVIDVNNANRIVIDTDGDVGIGFAERAVDVRLEVSGSPSGPYTAAGNAVFGSTLAGQGHGALDLNGTTFDANTGAGHISTNLSFQNGAWVHRNTGLDGWIMLQRTQSDNAGYMQILHVAKTTSAATEVFRITAGGNVGIGTANPGSILDVAGALTVREMAAPVAAPADQGRIYFDATDNKFKVSESGGGYVNLVGGGASGGTPALVFSTTNAAGAASTFLRTDDQIAIFDATTPAALGTAATGAAAFAARRDHVHPAADLGTASVTGTLTVGKGGTGTSTAFTLGSVVFAGAGGVYTQDNANFFWDNTGKRLGIGLTGPAATLHVVGSSQNTLAVDSPAYPEITHRVSGVIKSYDAIVTTAGGYFTGSAVNDWIFRNEGGASIKFGRGVTTDMTIDGSGNVGLSATSALVRLNVVAPNETKVLRLEQFDSSGNDDAIQIVNATAPAAGGWRLGQADDGDAYMDLAGLGNVFSIDSVTGNVGFGGVAAPADKVDVLVASNVNGGVRITVPDSPVDGVENSARLTLQNLHSTVVSNGNHLYLLQLVADHGTAARNGDFEIYQTNAGAGAVFVVDGPTGNIGIRESSPVSPLTLGIGTIGGTSGISWKTFGSAQRTAYIDVEATSDFRSHIKFGVNTTQADVAPVEVMRITNGGAVGIGTTAPARLFQVYAAGRAARFNRIGSDGIVIEIVGDGGLGLGGIGIAGTTVNYNAFTGSHYAWADKAIERGTLVSLTGENKYIHDDSSAEPIYGITKSFRANDPAILGAYLIPPEEGEGPISRNPHLVMSVGNGDMWVADSGEGDIEVGDYLISSDVPGHAMKDSARFPVSYVCARAAEAVRWNEVAETVEARANPKSEIQNPDSQVKHRKISVFFESFVREKTGGLSIELTALRGKVEAQAAEMDALKARVAALERALQGVGAGKASGKSGEAGR